MSALRWLIWLLPVCAWGSEGVSLNPDQENRYQVLTQELRCLVCQNQNIADSNAPLAQDLRAQVRVQIAAGRSDADIKQYMTDRYGEFVLYKPPFNLVTLLLWLGPALLVLVGLLVAVLRMRQRPAQAAKTVDAAKLKNILDDAP